MAANTPITPLRVLVTGHVNGNVGSLLSRVNTLGKKAPFDFLLITGDLFPINKSLSDYDTSWITEMQADDVKYQNLPSSIYAMGPRHESQKPFFRLLMATSSEPVTDENTAFKQGFDSLDGKLTILGNKGILTCSGSGSGSGMVIAYFSGSEADGRTYEDLDDLLLMKNVHASAIDVLMTSSWPKGIHHLSSTVIPADIILASENGSQIVTDLVLNLKPRYHFAASPITEQTSPGIYFERQPYRNHVMLQESNKPVTRFISLASVPGPDGVKKGPKWLYAFNIKPAGELLNHDKDSSQSEDTAKNVGRKELCHQPEDTTQPPFTVSIRKDRKSGDRNVQFFYSNVDPDGDVRGNRGRGRGGHRNEMGHEEGGDRRRRNNGAEGDHGHQDKRRRNNAPPFDTSQCWFCFSSSSVDKSLVVSIGDHAYLATAKGGLVPDHLLILPIEHIRSSLEAPNEMLVNEINKFKTALTNYFKSKDKIVAFFERNFKSNHMQIQVVPMSRKVLEDNQGKFNEEMTSATIKQLISEQGLDCEQLKDEEQLADVINPGVPFFYFEIAEIRLKLLIRIEVGKKKDGDDSGQEKDGQGKKPLFPLQLGRVIIAQLMGLDDESIVDWKNVTSKLNSEEESKRAITFRKQFEPFDFTIE